MSRIRVVVDVSAVPAKPAGAGVYVLRLVEAIARDAHAQVDLHLAAVRGDDERWRRAAPRAEVHAVVPRHRPLRLAWEQTAAPVLAQRLQADVWHGPHYTMPLRLRVPAVVTVHDLTFFEHPEWHERAKVAYFRRMIPASAARAAALVCVSAHTARRLAEVVGTERPVSVVPLGVDHDRFRPDGGGDDLALLATLGLRPPFIAFAGTIEPRKNLLALVRAWRRLRTAHPDIQLVLAGQPGWGSTEVEIATEHVEGILRLGYVEDPVVPALFRRAAAVAYPSREEGFGFPALEALACGAPLVTTTGSAMDEVVGDAAVLVSPGDDDALTAALGSILDGGAWVDRLRSAGPARAAAYTWEACAESHLRSYKKAAG